MSSFILKERLTPALVYQSSMDDERSYWLYHVIKSQMKTGEGLFNLQLGNSKDNIQFQSLEELYSVVEKKIDFLEANLAECEKRLQDRLTEKQEHERAFDLYARLHSGESRERHEGLFGKMRAFLDEKGFVFGQKDELEATRKEFSDLIDRLGIHRMKELPAYIDYVGEESFDKYNHLLEMKIADLRGTVGELKQFGQFIKNFKSSVLENLIFEEKSSEVVYAEKDEWNIEI